MKLSSTRWPRIESADIFVVVAIMAMAWPLAILDIHLEGVPHSLIHAIRFIIRSVGNAMLLAAPYFFLKPKWRWTVLIPVWIVGIFTLCNLWYFQYFNDLIPYSSLFAAGNFDAILFKSVALVMKPQHFMMLGGAVIATLAYLIWWRKKIQSGVYTSRFKIAALIISILPVCANEIAYVTKSYSMRGKSWSERMHKYFLNAPGGFSSIYEYQHGGLCTFIGRNVWYDMVKYLKPRELNAVENAKVSKWWKEHDSVAISNNALRKVFADNKGKNLIFIVVESFNSDAVRAEVNHNKVMPYLNRLLSDSTVVTCLNMRSQIKGGVSSDGQLIYNTGLYPTTDATAVLEYSKNTFPSLAKILGYNSTEIIVENPTFWNHDKTNKAYGYDGFVYNTRRRAAEKLVSQDQALFQVMEEVLDTIAKPCFVFAPTMTMHGPYIDSHVNRPAFVEDKSLPEQLKDYYTVCNEFDKSLAALIEDLKRTGIYDESVIVLASDHAGRIENRGQEQPIVFMVLNSGHGANIDSEIGQVDVFPTILEVMGVYDDTKYRGMGYSIFNPYRLLVNNQSFNRIRKATSASAFEISNKMMRGNWFEDKVK